jgi:hypothetical protein
MISEIAFLLGFSEVRAFPGCGKTTVAPASRRLS